MQNLAQMCRRLTALGTVALVGTFRLNRTLEFVLLLFELEATLVKCLLPCIQGSMFLVHGLVLRSTRRVIGRFMATPLVSRHLISTRFERWRTRTRG